jgi:hypothetical protein
MDIKKQQESSRILVKTKFGIFYPLPRILGKIALINTKEDTKAAQIMHNN